MEEEQRTDRTRPWHLKPTSAELMDGYWNLFPMVPLHLIFDDGSSIGQRVCAWVRPEDVWRFTDQEPTPIPEAALRFVKKNFSTKPPEPKEKVMTEVAARPKRTKEEWEALQAEQAKQEPPEWHGHTGTVEVKVKMRDGIEYWYAPSPVELDKMEHIKVEVRYRRRWRTRLNQGGVKDWHNRKEDDWVTKHFGDNYAKYKHEFGDHKVLPTGGSTDVTLFTHDGRYVRATVKCHQSDNFNKKIGYVLAVNRALTELQR